MFEVKNPYDKASFVWEALEVLPESVHETFKMH